MAAAMQERELARERGAHADQPGAEAVDRGGAQRLAEDGAAEEEIERQHQAERGEVDGDALAGDRQRAQQ